MEKPMTAMVRLYNWVVRDLPQECIKGWLQIDTSIGEIVLTEHTGSEWDIH